MMEFVLSVNLIKTLLPSLAIIAGVFVISTKNAIISVFNLIVLYVLVAFYLIYIGITYLGISYIVVYIGAIAILFLFVIMMIDVEVIEKRSNNYLPLLFLLLSGFLFTLRSNLYNLGLIKMKSLYFKEEYVNINNNDSHEQLFNIKKTLEKEVEFNSIEDKIGIYYNLIKNKEIDDSLTLFNNDNLENMHKSLFSDKSNYEFWNINLVNIQLKSEYNLYNNMINSQDNYKEYYRYNVLNSNIWNVDMVNLSVIEDKKNNYLLIITDWESALNKITQISAIGDVLYTVYHSYIYILSVILLLAMIGAIILTADNTQEVKFLNINKMSNIFFIFELFISWCKSIYLRKLINILMIYLLIIWSYISYLLNVVLYKYNLLLVNNIIYCFIVLLYKRNAIRYIYYYILKNNILCKDIKCKFSFSILGFFQSMSYDDWHSEFILGNLLYFVATIIFIAVLLLFINSYLSLNVKYLEKGGGFECGFTSFLQTRERFNVIFYRVSLLFLVFDLEIILIYPYPAIYQKNQNIGKNNVLIFIYILVIGFIYELKEGALNIVKKGRNTEINNIK